MAHIIVNDTSPRVQYTATAAQVDFTVPFPFFTESSLFVYKTPNGQASNDTNDLLTLNTDYTVTGEGNVAGVTLKITLTTGATAGDIITILRNEPIERTTDFQDNGDLLAETLNDEQDKEVMIMQQLEEATGRTIRAPVTDTATIGVMPSAADRAGKILEFNGSGDPVAVAPSSLISVLPSDALIYNTVASMVAASISDGATVFTRGYYSAGDGGSAVYLVKTAAAYGATPDEFGDHTLANGNVAVLQREPVANAKQYGATGDGVTDDLPALQAAVNASERKTLHVPEGVYGLSDTLLLNVEGIQFIGEASGGYTFGSTARLDTAVTIKRIGAATTPVVIVGATDPNGSESINRISFKNFSINGNATAGIGLRGQTCQFSEFENFTVDNFTFAGIDTGVVSQTFTGLNNFQNCYFKTFKIGASGAAVGLRIGGELGVSGMATSFCRFSDARIIHQNNTAVVVYKADDCFFDNVVTTRATGGTGRAVVLNGVANGHAYGLWFKGVHVGLGEGVTHHWVFAGVYTAGSYIQVGRNLYQTTAGGTAGSTKPVHTSGSVSDGGVTWTYINPSASVISSNVGTSAAHNYLEIAGIDTNVEVLEDSGTEIFYYYTGRQTNGALNQDRSKPRVKSPPLGFSNVETIDRTTIAWYESLTAWTPTLTFGTPGNLSVGYSTREASYTRIGHQITINWEIETSSFTHTTASGNLQITGVPFNTLKTAIGSVEIQGVSKANYTSFTSRITAGAAAVNVFASRPDGFGISAVSAADMPTGGNVIIRGTLTFSV